MCLLRLSIKFPDAYPLDPPTIEIIEHEQLSESELTQVDELIQKQIHIHLAQQEMMVFDICQAVYDWLNAWSEPRKKYIMRTDETSSNLWDKREEEKRKRGDFFTDEF